MRALASCRYFTKRDRESAHRAASRASSQESFGSPLVETSEGRDTDDESDQIATTSSNVDRRAIKKLSVIQAADEEAEEPIATTNVGSAPDSSSPIVANHHYLMPKSYSSVGAFAASSFHCDELSPIREIMEAGLCSNTAHDTAAAPDELNTQLRPAQHQRRRSWIDRHATAAVASSSSDIDDDRRILRRRRPQSARSTTSADGETAESSQLPRAPSVPSISQFVRLKAPMLRR